jgi:hypothetical protein
MYNANGRASGANGCAAATICAKWAPAGRAGTTGRARARIPYLYLVSLLPYSTFRKGGAREEEGETACDRDSHTPGLPYTPPV